MRVIFSEHAIQELDDAILYYETEYQGLGRRFRDEVRKAIRRILEYPKAWSIERGAVRKCLLSGFPCKILYSIEIDHIHIIAIAHQHRKPDYWIDRDYAQ